MRLMLAKLCSTLCREFRKFTGRALLALLSIALTACGQLPVPLRFSLSGHQAGEKFSIPFTITQNNTYSPGLVFIANNKEDFDKYFDIGWKSKKEVKAQEFVLRISIVPKSTPETHSLPETTIDTGQVSIESSLYPEVDKEFLRIDLGRGDYFANVEIVSIVPSMANKEFYYTINFSHEPK